MTVPRVTPQTAVVAFTVAYVTANTRHGRTRSVIARCPFCGEQHAHRWPLGAAEPGERAAHCGGGRYLLGASR